MGSAIAIFLKDLREFVDGWRPITFAVLMPALFVLVLGQLRTQPTTFRVLLAGSDAADSQVVAMAAMLRESSLFEVTIESAPIGDPLSVLRKGQIDLVCVLSGDDEVRAYSALTEPFRAALLSRSIDEIRAAQAASHQWLDGKRKTGVALAALGGGLQQRLATTTDNRSIVRFFQPVVWSGDAARISDLRDIWRRTAAEKRDGASSRVSQLLAEQTQRAAASLVEISQPDAQPSEALLDRIEADLTQIETTLEIAGEMPALRRIVVPSTDSPGMSSPVAGALDTARLAYLQLQLNKMIKDDRPYLDAGFARRVRRLIARANAVSVPPDGAPEMPEIAAIAREARDLVSVAASGGALSSADGPTLLDTLGATTGPSTLTLFHPLVLDRPRALLPEIVALVVCFLPFVLAAQSLLKERESRTAEILLCAPGVTPRTLFAGKVGMPLLIALITFGLAVALLQPVHHLYVKPGLLAILIVIVPAVLASTLIGLAASASAGTAAHATIVSAMYLLMITLFSSFLYPISSQNARLLGVASSLSPLTFVHPAMKAWMFGAPVPVVMPLLSLLAQCVVFGTIAAFAYRRWIQSI
jgi:hypothetical protein